MKKIYDSPLLQVTLTEVCNMIAQSIDSTNVSDLGTGGGTNGVVFEAGSKSRDDHEESEDAWSEGLW